MAIKRIKVGRIKVCPDVAYCCKPDASRLARLVAALRIGDELPPMVADRKSKLLVSGLLRRQAYLKVFGPDAKVEVDFISLPTVADRLLYRVDEDSTGPTPLTGISRALIFDRLEKLGVSEEAVAKALHRGKFSYASLAGRRVVVLNADGTAETASVKAGVSTDKVFTRAEYESHISKDVHMQVPIFANQLADHLNKGWVNLEDEKTQVALARLFRALEDHVMATPPEPIELRVKTTVSTRPRRKTA